MASGLLAPPLIFYLKDYMFDLSPSCDCVFSLRSHLCNKNRFKDWEALSASKKTEVLWSELSAMSGRSGPAKGLIGTVTQLVNHASLFISELFSRRRVFANSGIFSGRLRFHLIFLVPLRIPVTQA